MSILTRFFGRDRGNIQITLEPSVAPSAAGMSARALYKYQANLHAVVSFLSDSVAQLPLRVYSRNGETNRQRDRDSTISRLLYFPNRDQTWYEFCNALMIEYFLFGRALVWLLPDPDSISGYQLRIVPDEWVIKEMGETKFAPDTIRIRAGDSGIAADIARDDFVQFRMYDPGNPSGYQSPILALRQTLREQISADKFRTQVWESGGRFNAYITRPASVQPWDENTRTRFVEAFREAWAAGGANAGKMPLLEDGMEIKPYKFDAAEAQYAESKQLSREDVAAAYHINPSIIWHSTTQTYASAKDNARALYADCLGPVLQMLQQRINAFLLPKVGADPMVTYVEFDLTEKLKGSFEERASIIQSSVGAPWITRNEARADSNLPPIPGGDELVTPLNVLVGGQASPTDADSTKSAKPETKCTCGCHDHTDKKSEPTECISIKTAPTDEEKETLSNVLAKFFARQARSVLPRIGANDTDWWDEKRWNKELADDLEPACRAIAKSHGVSTAAALGSTYVEDLTVNYIRATAEARARMTNDKTRDKLDDAMHDESEDATTPAQVMEQRETVESPMLAQSTATAIAAWAVIEACEQAEDQPEFRRQHPHSEIYKTWVTGENPRDDHAAMDGETVPYRDRFSNGADWPGDDILGPDGTCGCNCTVDVDIIVP